MGISIQKRRDYTLRVVKRSELLYRLYLSITATGSLRTFASKKHHLCIEGYGRSGNTFAVNLVRELYPEVMVASHMHVIASLKAAFRLQIPTIVLIRHPSGCLASRMIKFQSRFGEGNTSDVTNFKAKKTFFAQLKTGFCPNVALWHLREYLDLYTYVEKQLDWLVVFDFETLIHDTDRFFETVCRLLDEAERVFDARKVEKVIQRVKEQLETDNRPAAERQLRSTKKDMLKSQVLKEINGLKEFEDACALYRRLTMSCSCSIY